MALLFIDGFNHYAAADTLKKYNSGGDLPITANSGRRTGSSAVVQPSTTGSKAATVKQLDVAASAGFVVGFACKLTNTSLNTIFNTPDNANYTTLFSMGGFSIVLSNSGLIRVSNMPGTFAMSAGVWYYFELKVPFATNAQTGAASFRVDGQVKLSSTTAYTLNAAASFNLADVAFASGEPKPGFSIADLYVCDLSGTKNNDFLGDIRIDTIFPDQNGTYQEFTPSNASVAHFTLVDETTPSATDYVDGNAAGQRETFGLQNIPALNQDIIYGIQVNASCLKDDNGIREASSMIRLGAVDVNGTSLTLSTTEKYISQVYQNSPAGSSFTTNDVNALEAGVRVTL